MASLARRRGRQTPASEVPAPPPQREGLARRTARALDLDIPRTEDAPREDLAAFERHAERLFVTGAKTDAFATACIGLLLWPTDLLLFGDGAPERILMAEWRIGLIITGFGTYLLLQRVPWALRRPFLVAHAALVAFMGVSGWLVGHLGGLDTPYFYGVYTTPLLAVLLVAPLVRQVGLTANIVTSFLLGYFVANPGELRSPVVGTPLVWLLATCAVALLVGQIIYALLRANFLQQRALSRHARELEVLDRAKNDFFANVNHELRTPLTNILGALRTVGGSVQRENLQEAVSAGVRNAETLLAMLADLLLLARLDSGRVAPEKRPVDLAEVVRRVGIDFQTGVEERLRVHTPGDGPTVAWVDPQQLRSVLYNLLSNAFKFSASGAPPVELRLLGDEDTVTLEVADRGIGIPKEHLGRIFERFHQVEGGVLKRHQGVGIGLSLVKEIVDAHGGEVHVESREGVGSTFTVRLPRGNVEGVAPLPYAETTGGGRSKVATREAQAASPPTEEPAEAPPGAPLVLVAEDDADLRAYLTRVLRRRYRVVATRDGAEALEAARREPPALVLTDLMMPVLSGTELLRALRADPVLQRVPVVVLTALTGRGIRVQSLHEGANDYVPKPFDEEELLARVDAQIRLADLTQRLGERVAEQTTELRLLASNLSSVQERERARIARDVHDALGQTLTGLRMQLASFERMIEGKDLDRARIGEGLAEAERLLGAVHESVTQVIRDLRPGHLEAEGLATAIDVLAHDMGRHHGFTCECAVGFDEELIEPGRAVSIFRIVQEALTNIARHAHATAAWLAFEQTNESLTIRIRDDGSGFDPTAVSGDHFGLLGMRERARALGGALQIVSTPTEGTELTVTLPLVPTG